MSEIKIKTKMKDFHSTNRIASDKKTEYPKLWQVWETIGILIYFWWECQSTTTLKNSLAVFIKTELYRGPWVS